MLTHKKHAFEMTPSEYFEATEREAYGYFSAIAARTGVATQSRSPIEEGLEPSLTAYNPVRVTRDFSGMSGEWDIYLQEEIRRVATPRVLGSTALPMLVRRSLVVMRMGITMQFPEEMIDRPPVYRSEHADKALLEVMEADVAFGGQIDPALRNQARYIGWLQVAQTVVDRATGPGIRQP